MNHLNEARLTDATVQKMLLDDKSLEEIIGELVRQKADYLERIIQLESIVPRKFIMPDGTEMIYYCPADLVPLTKKI